MENVEIVNNGTVTTIVLKGRVDTSTAPVVEETINNANVEGKVVIDANDLQYISSSGLRVLLKLAKKYPGLEVINVSEEIYEIFDVTGFVDIFTVSKK